MVLATGAYLFHCLLAAQVPLSRFAVRDLPVPVTLKRFDIPLCVFFIVIGKLEKSGKNNRFRLLRQAKCLFYIQS